MKLFIYNNSGTIDETIYNIEHNPITYPNLKEVLNYLIEKYHFSFDLDDLYVKFYAFDKRLNKNVYIITTTRMNSDDYIEDYKSPQFISYLINLEE